MSYPSNISGLDLFDMPFRRTQEKRQQAQASEQQMGAKPAAQQPKPAAPAVQGQKPESSAVQHKRSEAPAVQSNQTGTASRADLPTDTPVSEKKPQPLQPEAATPKEKALYAQSEETASKEAANASEQSQDVAQELPKSNVSVDTPKQTAPPQKELVLDMSAGTTDSRPLTADDESKRKAAHEAAEAKRKAEWEAKQLEKKQAEEAELQKLQNMTDDEAVAASIGRVKTDVERLTRRNMKECVAEHIQELCRKDPAFARLTMHPRKSMINCFKYINRMAKEYVKQEMEDNDIKPDNGGYGCDVPDGLCYQWAEDYFNDLDAPEDEIKEEKFVERPYTGASSKPKKAASKPKKEAKTVKKDKEKQETSSEYQQMSFV